MDLAQFPRVPLATLPTPLEEAPNLTWALGGTRILMKRDDLTGLAFGGNKVRKLEFIMADALGKGANVVITTGSLQSNHARLTAAAANKLGMKSILVLNPVESLAYQGNLLLNELLGADSRLVRSKGFKGRDALLDVYGDECKARGLIPYSIPAGGFNELGVMGYLTCTMEIVEQLYAKGLRADYLIVAAGTGGTLAGLELGKRAFSAPFDVIGIDVSGEFDTFAETVANLATETATRLGSKIKVKADELTIYRQYVAPGYGVLTPAVKEAIDLVAKTEGILLDPVYTGKTMAALIDLIRSGRITSHDTVIFLHTGGTPALFAYSEELVTKPSLDVQDMEKIL